MPDLLDINHLRARGLQPGEEELPDISPPIVIPDDSKGIIFRRTFSTPPTTLVCWNSHFSPTTLLSLGCLPSDVTHYRHTEVRPGCNRKLKIDVGRGTDPSQVVERDLWQQRAAKLQEVFRLCCLWLYLFLSTSPNGRVGEKEGVFSRLLV